MSDKRIAVIGLGNTLRRDDGIGIAILDSLLTFYKRAGVDYFNFGSASIDLVHKLRDYEKVLLIDGISANLPAGALRIFRLEEAAYGLAASGASTHALGLKELFGLCGRLALKTRVFVAGIQVADVSFGEGLTDELKKNKDLAVKEIDAFIANTLLERG